MSCSLSFLMLGFVLLTLGAMAGAHAPSDAAATRTNSTTSHQDDVALFNGTDSAVGSRVSTVLRDLPTIKNVVIFICVLTTLMIAYLVYKVYRSGKKIQKTRKYDIITTPAERVEMEPLNEENEDEEDSTLFDLKYS